ncbi:MAG TPA: hypothetical protein DCO79_15600 [Spirochaeta sp.]|nr:hypothetical protein [Spirochaeta sp.]
MQRTTGSSVCIAVIFILFSTTAAAGIDADSPEASPWFNMLGADINRVEAVFGKTYVEIPPAQLESRADRIIWYAPGLTLWFSDGALVQLRVDSGADGEIIGLKAGMSEAGVKRICGAPWIESAGSLYYNLPWQGGPVRLRFVFNSSGLDEIYLYYVR